ncbi:MAG: hypothetical protein LBQ03_02435 [Puniceicoccales bacterium]|jgi:serine/threonine protein kinase|nr:hypothetical protein [Puniceicoccales bacterium]
MQKKEEIILLLSCDLLVARLNATTLTVNTALDLEIGGNKYSKQALHGDSLSPQKLEKGAFVYLGKKLTTGGYGTIYEGFLGHRNFIIKQVRPEKGVKGQRGIQKELDNSKAFLDIITEKLGQDPIQYGKLLETDPIIPVIAQTTNGSLIQKRVSGQDLHKTVSRKRPPYRFGYPDHLQEAIERAMDFFRGLALLHHLGFVHCDIKPANVMIDDEHHLCHIIDLGGMKKFGERIQIHSNNGAPEFIEQTCTIKDYKAKWEKLIEERNEITKKVQQLSDEKTIEPLKDREKIIQEQLKTIATAIKSAKKICDATARPAYDIYSSAPILLTILFGKIGRQFAHYLYFLQKKDPVKFPYLQSARQPSFNADQYFSDYCFALNQMMQEKTGQAYSEFILHRLAQLLARMSSLDPHERPSAIEILETLGDMTYE